MLRRKIKGGAPLKDAQRTGAVMMYSENLSNCCVPRSQQQSTGNRAEGPPLPLLACSSPGLVIGVFLEGKKPIFFRVLCGDLGISRNGPNRSGATDGARNAVSDIRKSCSSGSVRVSVKSLRDD